MSKNVFDDLKNKVVVVTGGTRGIGFATVKAFLQQGSKVVMLGSRKETVDKALHELSEYKDTVMGRYIDLNDLSACIDLLKEVLQEWGSVDVLINNAGVSDSKHFYSYEDADFDRVMNINLRSVFLMSKAAAEVMKKQKKGVILNTSSMVSIYGQPAGVAYPTSKFAVNGMTKSLARELGKDGIRVNAVAPGIIATDMVKALDPNMISAMAKGVPVPRVGEPEDIANAFLFLASDMASYISGAVLSVDGAYVLG